MEKRESYGGVIDFQLLLDDYRNNSISERSFRCLDLNFFGPVKPLKEGEEYKQEEPKRKERVKMDDGDFGFCVDSDTEKDKNEEEKSEE